MIFLRAEPKDPKNDKSMMPNADSTYELPQGGIAGLGAVLLRAAERIGTVTEAARQAMMGCLLYTSDAADE